MHSDRNAMTSKATERTEAADPAALLAEASVLLGTDHVRALDLAREALTLVEPESSGAGHGLLLIGQCLARLGSTDEAVRTLDESLALLRQARSPLEVQALQAFARVHLESGETERANLQLTEALELSQALGDLPGQARTYNLLARASYLHGDPLMTIEHLERAIRLFREANDPKGESDGLTNLGRALTDIGHYPEALWRLREAYRLVREHRREDTLIQAILLFNIGCLHEEMNADEDARSHLMRSLALVREGGHAQTETTVHARLAEILLRLGAEADAETHALTALELSRRYHLRSHEGGALVAVAQVQAALGRWPEARATYDQAVSIARELDDRVTQVDAFMAAARAYLVRQEPEHALSALYAARSLAQESGRRRTLIEIEDLLSQACEQHGDLACALSHQRRFRELERALFNEQDARQKAQLSSQLELERARQDAELYRLRTEAAQQARAEAEAEVRARTNELELAQLESVTRLALAAEYRDDVTGKHTWRVGYFSALIAREVGLPEKDVDLLRTAARLHDVGKIGIPDAILLKPGRFTPEEYEIMKQHAARGAQLLSGGQSALLRMAEQIALTHHERWDGQGYPQGLAGEAIPLVGRVVAVADVFDALTHARPYKQAWTPQEALSEIERQSGTQFDPAVVRAALRVMGDPDFFDRLERELLERPELIGPSVHSGSDADAATLPMSGPLGSSSVGAA